MTKKETVRTSISFFNKALFLAAQDQSDKKEFGNLSAYIGKLILEDCIKDGIDVNKILKG